MDVESENTLGRIGSVAIGRNEGERLRRCLDSMPPGLAGLVYVDSGSTDGSVDLARERGVSVVELDMSVPFTAARARNAGFEHLLSEHPDLDAVQFVDGDCSVCDGWIEEASRQLAANPGWVAVCGWRRELYPERSVFNRLCDLEWIAPASGDVGDFGFGGDVLIRVDAFRSENGYDETLIAGEDPELSARLRYAGGEVVRVDREMTRHDADMHRASQWWRRSVRSGHAFAEVAALHRDRGLFRRNLRSLAIWGFALPVFAVVSAPVSGLGPLAVLSLYGLQIVRIARSLDPRSTTPAQRVLWGVSCMVSQLPKVWGVFSFRRGRARGRPQELIEYK
jgi:glycosyltransferase involved in cell wall biosynthesis